MTNNKAKRSDLMIRLISINFIHKDVRGNVSFLEVFLFGSIGSQMCGQASVGVNEMEW